MLERLPGLLDWGTKTPEFALCIGDDLADELMFTELIDFLGGGDDAHRRPAPAQPLGRVPTSAQAEPQQRHGPEPGRRLRRLTAAALVVSAVIA